METPRIYHNSWDTFYRAPFGAAPCGSRVRVRIKVEGPAAPSSVILRLWKEDSREEQIDMGEVSRNGSGIFYETEMDMPSHPGLLWYYFILGWEGRTLYYGNNPQGLGGVGWIYHHPPDSYQVTVYREDYRTPDWFKEAVMYQIFPDRFYNGNENSEVLCPRDDCVLHPQWDEQPNYKPDPRAGEFLSNDFFGGNLLGIIKKLPYLKRLGIRVIYLNPIFRAFSNHKYDTGNYMEVDPMFGDESTFRELCRQARDMGIAVMLDGVFSHTGSDSVYFNKQGNYPGLGAYQSKDSPYYPWYRFEEHPFKYDCWWNIKSLPNINEMEPFYLDYIIRNEDSVISHWMKAGCKGWRLDVVDELPDAFVKLLRERIKELDEEAVLLGEVWEDASHKESYGMRREYLLGEELDSVMNYPFRTALLHFLLEEWKAEEFHQHIMSLYENYPKEAFYAAMNLVGSHDVTRIRNVLGGAPPEDRVSREDQARYSLTKEQQELGRRRQKLAVIFQMTFPGVPSIYYGDEAGMKGYGDPFNRGTYPWGQEDKDLLTWYERCIGLRHSVDALTTGEFIPLYASGNIYAYMRKIRGGKDVFGRPRKDGTVVILMNTSSQNGCTVNIAVDGLSPGKLADALVPQREVLAANGRLTVNLQPLEGRILLDPLLF